MKNGINIPYTGRGKYLLVMFFFLVLSFVIAFLSITGNARIMFLILVFSLIPIILAYDFKKSIMGLIVFYAFMGFFRRFFYTINPYTRLDPIYIIPDIFASTLFVYLLILKKNKIFRTKGLSLSEGAGPRYRDEKPGQKQALFLHCHYLRQISD